MVAESFRASLRDALVKTLDTPSSDFGASITRDCTGLLCVARQKGGLDHSDLDLRNSYFYADLLTAAGFLTKQGDKMSSDCYTITERGRSANLL